jgi:hypothetical protein
MMCMWDGSWSSAKPAFNCKQWPLRTCTAVESTLNALCFLSFLNVMPLRLSPLRLSARSYQTLTLSF